MAVARWLLGVALLVGSTTSCGASAPLSASDPQRATPTESTATSTAVATSSPVLTATAAAEPSSGRSEAGAVTLTDDVVAAVSDGLTAGQADCLRDVIERDGAFVQRLNRADLSHPESDVALMVDVMFAALECAPEQFETLSTHLAATLTTPGQNPAEVADCFYRGMTEGPDRRDIAIAMASAGMDLPVFPRAIEPTALLMDDCMSAAAVFTAATDHLRSDPAVAAGLDVSCLDARAHEAELLAVYRAQLTQDPTDEFTALSEVVAEAMQCVSFGRVHEYQEGIELDPAQRACLDASLGDFARDRVALALQGVSDEDAEGMRQILIDDCLG